MNAPITWLVQSNLLDISQLTDVVNAIRASGGDIIEAVVVPFQQELGNPEAYQKLKHCSGAVIPYGSTKLTKIVSDMGLRGDFFDNEAFKVSNCLAHNKKNMLNADAKICKVSDLENTLLYKSDDDLIFVRPNEDLKKFNGTVTTVREAKMWLNSKESGSIDHTDFNANTVVAVSSPKNIAQEQRWFIVGGKVIDGSIYRLHRLSCLARDYDLDASILDQAP